MGLDYGGAREGVSLTQFALCTERINAQTAACVSMKGRVHRVAMNNGWHIGTHHIPTPWMLAPMSGISDRLYREIARRFGASATPTELISSKGLCYASARTLEYLDHDADLERPFWVQLFGGDPESMASAAQTAVENGADIIDINMGCPMRKVTRQGAGSALMTDPSRAAAIVRAIIDRTGVPVTAKIRTGWDQSQINFVEVAKHLEDAGVATIAMHARTRAQCYNGTANWAHITELVNATSIPIIGNGDVKTATDAKRMQKEPGCQGVFIGRGSLGNPWLFAALRDGAERITPSPNERWQVIDNHLREYLKMYPRRGVRAFRKHLLWYSNGLNNAAAFRGEVSRLTDPEAVINRSREYFAGAAVARGQPGAILDTLTAGAG